MDNPAAVYEYLIINEIKPPKKRKTRCFEIINKRGDCLGYISWYSSWRQYCFTTGSSQCVFSKGCLDDMSDFLRQLNK